MMKINSCSIIFERTSNGLNICRPTESEIKKQIYLGELTINDLLDKIIAISRDTKDVKGCMDWVYRLIIHTNRYDLLINI